MRESDIAEIPLLKISNSSNTDEPVSAIVKNLIGRGQLVHATAMYLHPVGKRKPLGSYS